MEKTNAFLTIFWKFNKKKKLKKKMNIIFDFDNDR